MDFEPSSPIPHRHNQPFPQVKNHSLKQLGSRRTFLRRGGLFLGGVTFAGIVAACSSEPTPQTSSTTEPQTVPTTGKKLRLGYQKSSTVLNLLKNQQHLEKRFAADSIAVEWSEFAAGPQMLEALNVGSIDIAYTGETPPIFAQAAGAPLVYVAFEPVGPQAEAILVQSDSTVQRVADLKGKRVALNKGSNVHYLLVKALEEAGLKYSDIVPTFLPPGDARPAFEQKSVDAWVIWDPFQAAAEKTLAARVLRDGKDIVQNRGFYLATRSFVDGEPELLKALLEELQTVSNWAKDNPKEVAQFLSAELGIPEDVLALAESRRDYGIQPITTDVMAYQQNIAETFYTLQLIPKQIDTTSAVWSS